MVNRMHTIGWTASSFFGALRAANLLISTASTMASGGTMGGAGSGAGAGAGGGGLAASTFAAAATCGGTNPGASSSFLELILISLGRGTGYATCTFQAFNKQHDAIWNHERNSVSYNANSGDDWGRRWLLDRSAKVVLPRHLLNAIIKVKFISITYLDQFIALSIALPRRSSIPVVIAAATNVSKQLRVKYKYQHKLFSASRSTNFGGLADFWTTSCSACICISNINKITHSQFARPNM